jgi:polysaccharide biosynthesis transport protein
VTEKTIVLPPDPSGNGHNANYRLTMMVPKRHYLSYLRERWWVILICVAAMVSAILAYETVRPQNYTSYAQIYLSGNVQIEVGSVFSEESPTYFGTQIELLKSARLQSVAFKKAGITIPPGQKNPYKVEIVQPLRTSILQLVATGPDQELTQSFLMALIDGYLAYKKETRIMTSQDILDSLNDELAKRAADLQAEQDKWAEYQRSNNVAVLAEDGRSAGMYLSDLNLQLAKLNLEQNLLSQGMAPETIASPIATNSESFNAEAGMMAPASTNLMASFPSPATTNSVATTDDYEYNSARLELAVLLANREDKVRAIGEHGYDQEVARLQRLIAILIEDKRTKLQERISAIETAIPSWEAKVLDINNRLSQGDRLKGNIARLQGYYDHLLAMLQNVDLGKNVQQEQLSVLQAATSAVPEHRSIATRLVIAGVSGLFLSLAIVFVWYLLDDRFVSVRDIKDQFGETILGLVPQIKVPRAKPQQALLENEDARLGYVESFRHLRSALLLSSPGGSVPQTLLFTSAAPAEGKTTLAVNLARLLARSGLRVVLVDADVRGGGLSRLLGSPDQPGLLDFLRGHVAAETLMQPTEFAGLFLIPGGTHNDQSEGLFLRPKLAEFLAELRQNADFVILDGAPILASDDTAFLVSHMDTVVLVTRPFYTRSRLLRQALDMLYQRQVRQVNIIFNRARADDLIGHYAMNGLAKPAGARKM